jgi:hypothetical protein
MDAARSIQLHGDTGDAAEFVELEVGANVGRSMGAKIARGEALEESLRDRPIRPGDPSGDP